MVNRALESQLTVMIFFSAEIRVDQKQGEIGGTGNISEESENALETSMEEHQGRLQHGVCFPIISFIGILVPKGTVFEPDCHLTI